MTPRDYQLRAIQQCREHLENDVRSIIIHSGTGTGKTVIAAEITRLAVVKGSKVLFLAHRRELIDQAFNKMADSGIRASVVMAGDPRHDSRLPVCIASVQTLVNRRHKPPADIIVIDECHHARAATYEEIIKCYPDALLLGLTATPCRSDDKGLGDMFQVMVSCPSVAEMTHRINPETGVPYLVPTKVFAPGGVDTRHLKVSGGEYDKKAVAQECAKPRIVGDIVRHWLKLAGGKQTVVFAGGVEASQKIVEKFRESGVKAEHLDGTTDKDLRRDILARLESGETTVVSNFGVLTEGWDSPRTAVCVIARPTKSTGLFLQMVGRALRPSPGKSYCLVLDHANCHAEHGFVDDDREWSLEAGIKKRVGEKVTSVATCMRCFATFRSGPDRCPFCGAPMPKQARTIQQVEGELEEIQRAQKAAAIEAWRERAPADLKKAKFLELRREGRDRKFKRGYAMAKFKAIYKMDPHPDWWKEAI